MKHQLGIVSSFVLALLVIVNAGPQGTARASEAPAGPAVASAAISQNVAWVGHVSGMTGAIAVRGNYAYAGEGPRLTVLNVTNPAAPVVVGQSALLPVTIGGLAVAGNYVYTVEASGDEGGLRVFNVANPAAPVEVAYRATPGRANDVAIAGNYAYVADNDYGLRVFDVANPAAPVEVGAIDTPGYASDVVVVGNYAYVADYRVGGLRIINVANPATPVEVGSLVDHDIAAAAVAVSGSYAYVLAGGVWVINVANPAAPVEVGQFGTGPSNLVDIVIDGNYAYLAVASGLQILNVANPAAPVEVAAYETPGYPYHLAVAGAYAYLAADSGTHVINVANPAAPVEAGARRTPPASDVVVAGNYAYVSDEDYGLRIMNVANPAAPVGVGAIDTPGYINDVVVVGHYAYVADGSAGLQILSVANPAAPVRLGGIDLPGWAIDVAVAGNYAYVATDDDFDDAGHNGLRIINIANPAAPVEVAAYDTPGWAVGVAVASHYAYVADYNGLVIMDVANPAAPTPIGSYAYIGAQRVAVAGDYAYVTSELGGLQIINVANPAAPIGAGYYDTPDYEWLWEAELSVAGNYAYLAHEERGLRIIDVTNPAAPVEAGFYDTAERTYGVAVSGAYVYVADYRGGLVVLRFTALPSTDQQLANRYAPIVRMHTDDRMVPMSVDLALQHAICLKRQPGMTANCATSEAVTTALLAGDTWRNEADAYIDFGGNPTGSGEQGSQYYFVMNVMNAARQSPLVYAQVTPDNRSDGRRVVQYWIYYYYNLWWNKHEGDWEMIQVELDDAGQPQYVAYAQHGEGSKREWGSVARVGDHPIVYPGLGSHASYFYPGSYMLGRDTTATYTQYEEWQPSAQLVSAASATWLTFAGHWGEKDVLPGQSGPSSPARTPAVDNPKWYDPLWWSSQQAFDEQAKHNRGKPRLSAALDCRVGIEDTVTGQKWGWIDGAFFDEIPFVEAIRNASLSQTTTILHGDLGQFQQKYRVQLEGCGLVADQASPATAGAPLAVIEFADSATNEVVRLTYDVPAGWDAATSAAEVTLSPVEPPTLRVDLNGDDTIDLSEPPASSGETPLYPPPVADFAAAPLSGSVALPVTFADASTGWPDSWLWEFGDGQTSTDQNPTHLYQQAGVYTVSLTVSNPTGSDTETRSAYVAVTPSPAAVIYLSPIAASTVSGKAFTSADILSYTKSTNTWDVLYDGSYANTPKNLGAFAFQGDDILLGFSVAQVVPSLGTTKVAPQDLVRFTPTSTGYNNTAGAFAWFFDGSDVGLTTSGEIIDALWIDAAGRLYISTAGSGVVPVNSANPSGAKMKFQDEDVLRFTPSSTGATTAGTWELYWNPTIITGMSAEDINGYWEDPTTGHRYVTIVGAFNLGNAAYGGKFAGNGTSILRFVPNAAAPGGWAPAEKLTWLATGATLPAKFAIDGIEMAR